MINRLSPQSNSATLYTEASLDTKIRNPTETEVTMWISRVMLACQSRVTDPQHLRKMLKGVGDYWLAVALAVAGHEPTAPDEAKRATIKADAVWIKVISGV